MHVGFVLFDKSAFEHGMLFSRDINRILYKTQNIRQVLEILTKSNNLQRTTAIIPVLNHCSNGIMNINNISATIRLLLILLLLPIGPLSVACSDQADASQTWLEEATSQGGALQKAGL